MADRRRSRWTLRSVARTRLSARQVALCVAAVLVCGELWARAVGPYLPPSELGDAPEMELKLDRMAALGAADVVLLGNSMVDHGLDPAAMAATEPALGTVYNAALAGAPLSGIQRWADRFVLPRLHPDTVVVGLNPVSLVDIDPVEQLSMGDSAGAAVQVIENRFFDSLARLDPGPLQRAEDRIEPWSALIRHRATLRNPRDALRGTANLLTGTRPGEGVPQVALEDGVLVARTDEFWDRHLTDEGFASQIGDRRSEQIDNPDLVRQMRQVLDGARYDRSGLRALLTDLDDRARRVVVVVLPLAPGMLRALGPLAASLDEGRRAMAEVARATGAEVVDLTDVELDDSHFADPAHVNVPGARLLSAALAQRL